jgi:predicted dienelactone hydrolase
MRSISLQRLTMGMGALVLSLSAAVPAIAAGHERGPAPTRASLEAAGPYSVDSFKITNADAKSYGYGGATVYFPKGSTETFGLVSLTPGFLGFQTVYQPLAERVASHGFVVINLDTNTLADQPDLRAKEMAGALKHVIELAQGGKAPYASVLDATRRGVMGHSMGGGGTLAQAVLDPSLKAAVPITPWHTTKTFAKNTVPTLILACEKDGIAPNKTYSDPMYASLNTTLPRGEIEVKGADHLCPLSLAKAAYQTTVSKSVIAWLKRFMDEDTRYDALVKGEINNGDYSRFEVKGF